MDEDLELEQMVNDHLAENDLIDEDINEVLEEQDIELESDEVEEVSDEEEEASEEEEEEEEVDAEAEEAEEEVESEEEEVSELLKAMDGDEEVEVPKNLELSIGEEKVSMDKLIETFESHKKNESAMAEFEKNNAEFREKADAFNNNAQQFQELVNEGKAQEALDFVLGVSGIDAEHFANQYVSQLAPKFEEFMQLTPAEQEQRQAQQENDYLKRQVEGFKNRDASKLNNTRMEREINSVLEETSMDLKEFESLQSELLQLVDEGRLDKAQITPKFIGEQHLGIKRFEQAYNVLEEINPELVKNKVAVDHLVSIQNNDPKVTKEALKEQAERAFAESVTKKVEKRVKKNVTKTKARKLGKKQRAVKSSKLKKDVLSFGDLDINELTNLL